MRPGLVGAIIGLAIALGGGACDRSSSSQSGKPSETGGTAAPAGMPSAVESEAREAALAEIGRHWSKGPDGWTTAVTSGSPYAPDHFLRQFRDLVIHSVEPHELDQSDRMNGLEWAGQVYFEKMPYREAGDPGLVADGMLGLSASRQRGRWSQWFDFQPEALRLQKLKGKWQVNPGTFLLRGRIPQPQDFSAAGVH